jgi:hypothetical protein
MNAEPLRIVLSKIAPLEQWNAAWSDRGPRICWKLFRPNPQQADSVMQVIGGFHGHGRWYLVGNCLQAVMGEIALGMPRGSNFPSIPSAARISEADAASDLTALANELEKRLDLVNAQPMALSATLLTKEGLQKSRGPYEDFSEGGPRFVYLITDPRPEVLETKKTDIMLHFEPMEDEMRAIFGDIVGADLTRREFESLTESEVEKISREFPILWKISQYEMGAYLTPQEAEAFLRECVALDKIVVSPKAVRGLDKAYRIANWASKKQYGVFFDTP